MFNIISAVDAKVNQWLWGWPHDAGENVCWHFERSWITAFAVQSTWQWYKWCAKWYMALCFTLVLSCFLFSFLHRLPLLFIKSLYFWSHWCSDIYYQCTWCRPGVADKGKYGVVFCREKEPALRLEHSGLVF